MLFARPQAITTKMAQTKVTCHGAGLVAGDADFKNSFTVFVEKGKIGGISVAFEGKLTNRKRVMGIDLILFVFQIT